MVQIVEKIDYKSITAQKQLVNSLHNTGFAVLYNHPINQKIITFIYNEWTQFFYSNEKHSYTFNPKTQDGYFPYRCENAKGSLAKDLKEFYHLYEWGKHPENISNKTILLYHDLLKIGQIFLKWIDINVPEKVSYNFSIPLSQMINDSKMNLLRIIHYPPLDSSIKDGELRAAAHEDINLITILVSGTQPGLQVRTKGRKWVDVECNPGWLVINTGDMLSECSKGYFPSTSHRVINPNGDAGKLPRYSMPLFIHPRDEVVLSDKYTAKSFLDERLKEIGLKY